MEAGQTIAGKYRLHHLLGTVGMASVWAATNVFTDRQFAIKFMLPQVARTPESARRFLLEAKVSARINHPNVIEVIDVGQAEDGSLFLVMELLTGMALDAAIRRHRPPMTAYDLMLIMRDVAAALAAAHRSGVVHRDLKPTNIFLHTDRDGKVLPKILDFGVSKFLEDENSTALTVIGTVLGSPLYMSPEQAMGAPGIDGRTDVFAFGGILFEALTAQRPFEATNFNALIVAIATKQPRSVDEVAPQLPEELRALVRDCLVTDKERRLANFDVVGERIGALIPSLQPLGLRLPNPFGVEPDSDPELTNVRRVSDSLPLLRAASQSFPTPFVPGTSAVTPGPHASPLPMQITNSPLVQSPAPPVAGHPAGQLIPPRGIPLSLGGLAAPRRERKLSMAILLSAAVIGLGAAFVRIGHSTRGLLPSPPAPQGAAGLGASTAEESVPPPPAPPSAQPPTRLAPGPSVPVDSLPSVAHPNAAKGKLSIAAGPGWCSVSIDGVGHGVTPVSVPELAPGAHRVDCVTPNGKTRSATVTVSEGGTARQKFALDE
jgi:serine/threonine-protein kinase